MPRYETVRRDLTRWMKEDQSVDARFSTMFDLYALDRRFPGFDEAKGENDARKKVRMLEEAFAQDIDDPRFIPYLQLHEFEALILSAPERFDCYFLTHEQQIAGLQTLCEKYDSPEEINDNPQTAPSRRIINEIPEYADVKPTAGSVIAREIGLPKMRERCPHFDKWVTTLEGLNRED